MAGDRAAHALGKWHRRTALQCLHHRDAVDQAIVVGRLGRFIGDPGMPHDRAGPVKADDDGDVHRLRARGRRRLPAGPEMLEHVLDGVHLPVLRMGGAQGSAQQRGGDQLACHPPHLTSAATCTLTILSGLAGGSPLLILSTTSMPATTLPITVYLLLRKEASAKQMKNCELAESLLCARAMPTVQRLKCSEENSCFRFGYFEPPVPLKFAPSPVCAMKPSITRWNGTLS